MGNRIVVRARAKKPPVDTDAAPEVDKPTTLADVRQKAARVTSGLAGGLNVIGALAKAAGVVVGHVGDPASAMTGRGLSAIGEQLVGAAQSLGAASSLIGGSVVVAEQPEEGFVEAEVIDEKTVPSGRKPRRAGG